MRYALLVAVDENVELSEDDVERRWAEFMGFQDEMDARGVLVSRDRLQPTALATTVRLRDEGLVVADGPFAETKEQIAGFYIIECEDLDEAIEIASRNPGARYGTIEVRPVWEI
ncbi:MAG: YciI family protein [Solirubrobacterales bacterium]|nr:YciI family protein [Solirubrobacterales bacterium]